MAKDYERPSNDEHVYDIVNSEYVREKDIFSNKILMKIDLDIPLLSNLDSKSVKQQPVVLVFDGSVTIITAGEEKVITLTMLQAVAVMRVVFDYMAKKIKL